MRSLIIEIEPFMILPSNFAANFFCKNFIATIGLQFFHCKIFPEMTIVTPVSAVISPTVPELKLYFGSDKDSFLN